MKKIYFSPIFSSETVGQASEERLKKELAEGKPRDDKAQLEMGGSLAGYINRKERDDESQTQDRYGPRQGDEDQFFAEG